MALPLTDFISLDSALDDLSHTSQHHSNWAHPVVYPQTAIPAIKAESWDHMEVQHQVEEQTLALPTTSFNCIPPSLTSMSSRSPSPALEFSFPGAFEYSQSPPPQQSSFSSPGSIDSPTKPSAKKPTLDAPHPYSISPSNTTALFARASTPSGLSSTSSGQCKKSRAPPSGPISTKDFIPPDVSGLSKREARLVKNRAAAFLSRQRKREEFEGLEARVEVLESDNARLYKELEAYRSGSQPQPSSESTSSTTSDVAILNAELVGLKRQLAARDAEIKQIHQKLVAANDELSKSKKKAEESDDDSDDSLTTVHAPVKKDNTKIATGGATGSVAFMVLLFSLSTLLTNGGGETKPPTTSQRVQRPSFHHRRSDSTQSWLNFPPSYGTPEDRFDSLINRNDLDLVAGGLSADSAFAGLTATDDSSSLPKAKSSGGLDEDMLRKAISEVKTLGHDSFEFNLQVPSSSERLRVSVKADRPISAPFTSTPSPSSKGLGRTFPSPFEFKPDDLDTFSFPPPESPTNSESTVVSTGKRKRGVHVEIKRLDDDEEMSSPRPVIKRKLWNGQDEDENELAWY